VHADLFSELVDVGFTRGRDASKPAALLRLKGLVVARAVVAADDSTSAAADVNH
jgi:hypothetical protein